MKDTELIRENIIRDMSDGAFVIGLDGRIIYVNPAALAICDMTEEELTGRTFAECFFDYPENDAFAQSVLDAIYESGNHHESIVPLRTKNASRLLRVTTSFLKENDRRVGVIAVLSDITELNDLRDAVKAMNRIKELNKTLEIRNRLIQETFGRYLSDDIVRTILETPDGLAMGGKRRDVTVLMSDLRGFTSICERMEASSVLVMLNRYFEAMYAEIERYGGTLLEFMGDGLFVVFGAPVASDDHASKAVACAVAMQKRMAEVNAWNESNGFTRLAMGIGLNTGPVIVGNIGSERRTKYGVMGRNVNLAGRAESYTADGDILITPETKAAVREELVIDREIRVTPKGVNEPIVLSYVRGIGAPYGLCLESKVEEPIPLTEPVTVYFRPVRGKHVAEETRKGVATASSKTRAVIETEPIPDADSILFDGSGDRICAKIVARTATTITVAFDDVFLKTGSTGER